MLKTLNIKALSISIAFLVLSGCSVLSSSKSTTTEKRAIETREYSVDTKTLIQVLKLIYLQISIHNLSFIFSKIN